jgi:hypothetical protein
MIQSVATRFILIFFMFLETARKQNQNKRYKFSKFHGVCFPIDSRLYSVLPNVLYMVCSCKTSGKNNYIMGVKIERLPSSQRII